MALENITKILDSDNLTNREKQVLLSIYRLWFKDEVKKVNGRALADYMGDKLDRTCKFIRGLQEKNLIMRDSPRGNIKINWNAIN